MEGTAATRGGALALNLDGSASHDVDYGIGSGATQLSYTWSCRRSGVACTDFNGNDVAATYLNQPIAVQTIPGMQLEASLGGIEYVFYLTVTELNGVTTNRTANMRQTVTLISGNVPVVKIEPIIGKVDPSSGAGINFNGYAEVFAYRL